MAAVRERTAGPAEYRAFLRTAGGLCSSRVARPLFIAHRGASAHAPENTLAAFERALADGADGVELDVRITRDGVPVVCHDARLGRLASRRGAIAQLTRDELHAVRLRGEPLPTLAEAHALTAGRGVTQIEIKPGVPVAPVVQAVQRARAAGAVVFASFDAAIVDEARRLAPGIPRMLICGYRRLERGAPAARVEALVPILAALGATGVSIDWRALRTPDFIPALKSRGPCVWCWTVNDPRVMRRLADWGVDAILTDDPARLRSTLLGPGATARSRPAPG